MIKHDLFASFVSQSILNKAIQNVFRLWFRATSWSTYDFSSLYAALPHNLIKEKLLDLIEWTFKRALKNYGSLYLACNDRKAFFTSSDQSRYTLWSCQNVCDALSYRLDNIYIRSGTKLYRQIIRIPMGTNCEPLMTDLFYTATKKISWILLRPCKIDLNPPVTLCY